MADSANTGNIAVRNDILAPKFVQFANVLVPGFSEHSNAALALHPEHARDSVLDAGCGFDDTEAGETLTPGKIAWRHL